MSKSGTLGEAPGHPRATAELQAKPLATYHVFLASPGDVGEERQRVRSFFERYNRNYAEPRGVRFQVIDWENYSSAGVGRPQELITEQTLERYKASLAMVIGIMAQRFGSPSGVCESGTEEEFEWAMRSQGDRQFPVVKWFFKDVPNPTLRDEHLDEDVAQWKKVKAFRQRVDASKAVFFRGYADAQAFDRLLENDVAQWLAQPDRPWFRGAERSAPTHEGWSAAVLEALAQRLDAEYLRHLQAGESASPADTRGRYVASVVQRRAGSTGEGSASEQGILADFVSRPRARVLLVGPGGRGKTTTLRHHSAEGARRALADGAAPVCIHLSLTTFEADGDGLRALLGRLAIAAGIDRDELHQRWQFGPRPILFSLDALNEVSRAHVDSCTKALVTLIQGGHAEHRYLISARAGSDLEQMGAEAGNELGLSLVDLQEFDEKQVQRYLRAQGRGELEPLILQQLKGLAKNPFLLWAITKVYSEAGQGLRPKNRGSLFRALIDGYIYERREQAKPKPRPTAYNFQLVKKPLLAALAAKMLDAGSTTIEEGPELLRWLGQELKALATAHEYVYPLEPETFMPAQPAATVLIREIVDNGVLVREGNTLRFMHEAVQEYFAALSLSDRPVDALVKLAPVSYLAYPLARGPMFEALVTWAGLVPTEQVDAVAGALRQTHPLLAVQLWREAGRLGQLSESLQEDFAKMIDSDREARHRLGVRGLIALGVDDPSIVRRLITTLAHKKTLYVVVRLIGQAFSKNLTEHAVHALVVAAAAGARHPRRVLESIAGDAPLCVANALLNAWNLDLSREALPQLVLEIDRDLSGRRKGIADALLRHSVEAELNGQLELSRSLDVLASRPSGLGTASSTEGSTSHVAVPHQQPDAQAAPRSAPPADNHTAMSTEDLIHQAATSNYREWRVLRNELRQRAEPDESIITSIVTHVLAGSSGDWLQELERLPREAVVADVSPRLSGLDPGERERAEILLALLADSPSPAILKQVSMNHMSRLRRFAARSVARAGAPAVECLAAMLDDEDDPLVIKAVLFALASIGDDVAVAHLIRLLDPRARRRWPYQPSNDDTEDGWLSPIVSALEQARAHAQTLRALEARPHDDRLLVDVAGRWLEHAKAGELLRQRARTATEVQRRHANWYLAQDGDIEAFVWLFADELRSTDKSFSLGSRTARQLRDKQTSLQPHEREQVDATRALLLPALRRSNRSEQLQALRLTKLLGRWVDAEWRTEALTCAEMLVTSEEQDEQSEALSVFGVFAQPPTARLQELLLTSPHESIREEVRRVLGDAVETLGHTLERAIASGDAPTAWRAARAAQYDVRQNLLSVSCDTLQGGNLEQCVAALSASGQVWIDYETGARATLVAQVRAAFARLGAELWHRYAIELRGFDLQDQLSNFVVDAIVSSLLDQPHILERIIADGLEIWPGDIALHGAAAENEMRMGRMQHAVERLEEIASEFGDRVNVFWLSERFGDLKRPASALRCLQSALERGSDDPALHLNIGWYAFLAGDLDASIAASQRCIERSLFPAAACNLGLAQLARGDLADANLSYRRGLAIARRIEPGDAVQQLQGALNDLPLLVPYAVPTANIDPIRDQLQAEHDRLSATLASRTPTPS